MKFNHTWMAASISLRWVMRLYHWSSTAHPHEGTTSRCLCVCAVCQSLVKVEMELIMDVAWLATVAAANIRAGQWQEDLCMWLLGACDWKPTEMWLRKAREMQLSRKETRTAPGSHCAVSRRGGGGLKEEMFRERGRDNFRKSLDSQSCWGDDSMLFFSCWPVELKSSVTDTLFHWPASSVI